MKSAQFKSPTTVPVQSVAVPPSRRALSSHDLPFYSSSMSACGRLIKVQTQSMCINENRETGRHWPEQESAVGGQQLVEVE
jgi:hypothetical protein